MAKNKKKPDWNTHCGLWGNKFPKDFPKPHIWYFPHPEGKKRQVKWWIESFRDYSYDIGAKHYYAHLNEEENTIWSVKDGTWCRPWGNRGVKCFMKRSISKEVVERWIKKTFKEEFDSKTHVLVSEFDYLI